MQDTTDGQEKPLGAEARARRATSNTLFTIIVLAVSSILILSIIVIPGYLSREDVKDETLQLVEGDYFNYSVDWPEKPLPDSSFVNFTLDELTETSMMTAYLGGNCPDGFEIYDISPFITRGDGIWVRNEIIRTPFGDKCTEMFLSVSMEGEVFLKYVGSESRVVYLMVAGGVGEEYSVELTSSNNTSLNGLDEEFQVARVLAVAEVTDAVGAAYHLDIHSGTLSYGALKVEQGEKVRYELDGGEISVWFLSMEDIEMCTSCHKIAFNSSLSTLAGNPGFYSYDCEPGIYLYIIHVGHSDQWQHLYRYWKLVET